MKLYPSLLTDNPGFFQSELNRFAEFEPQPDVVQVDIIDGEFADNLTVEAGHIRSAENPGFRFDIHLMTIEPAQQLEEFWGLQSIRAVIGQIERMHDVEQFVADVQEGGWLAGLSLDIFTPVAALEEFNLETVAIVQLMGNQAGKQGQEMHPGLLDKVAELKTLRSELGLSFEIYVDIGVNEQTAPSLMQAGVDGAVLGSAIQGSEGQVHWKALHTTKG